MTITNAVDDLKDAAMNLSKERKNLLAANKELERVKDNESAARGRYALALSALDEQTGIE